MTRKWKNALKIWENAQNRWCMISPKLCLVAQAKHGWICGKSNKTDHAKENKRNSILMNTRVTSLLNFQSWFCLFGALKCCLWADSSPFGLYLIRWFCVHEKISVDWPLMTTKNIRKWNPQAPKKSWNFESITGMSSWMCRVHLQLGSLKKLQQSMKHPSLKYVPPDRKSCTYTKTTLIWSLKSKAVETSGGRANKWSEGDVQLWVH